jgi:hypothetical protein
MLAESYSLDNLRDIVIPQAPSIWPFSTGLWLSLIVVTAILAYIALRWYSAHKRNAYRRAGLNLLAEARTVHDVSVILKRVALAAYPRELVASVYGDQWQTFLDKTCPKCQFAELTGLDGSGEADQRLRQMASRWIEQHRVSSEMEDGHYADL